MQSDLKLEVGVAVWGFVGCSFRLSWFKWQVATALAAITVSGFLPAQFPIFHQNDGDIETNNGEKISKEKIKSLQILLVVGNLLWLTVVTHRYI